MDRNGYNSSIVQDDLTCCYWCGARDQHLDRHEIFGGASREKSKRLGLWVLLCHDRCHLQGAHRNKEIDIELKKAAERAALTQYGWTVPRFIGEFGYNVLEERDLKNAQQRYSDGQAYRRPRSHEDYQRP